MKKYLILIFAVTFIVNFVSADEAQKETLNPDAPREYIVYDNDGFIFGTYIRYGYNMNTSGNAIDGTGFWNVENGYNGMRYMNEGNYSEWLFAYESPDDKRSNWWGGAYLRMAYDLPTFSKGWYNISDQAYGYIIPEAYVRMGYGNGISFWGGRRYNSKIAIGMMDYYVANLDGNGVGVESVPLGEGTLNFHWIFSYDTDATSTAGSLNGSSASYAAKQTWALDLQGFDAGPGSFSVIIAPSYQGANEILAEGEYKDPLWGGFTAVKYNMDSFFTLDGNNEFFASFGLGSGANQHADMANGYEIEDWSLLAGYQGYSKISPAVSLKNTLYYETRSWNPGSEGNFISFGLRPMIKQNDFFGWQFEYDLEASVDTSKYVNRFTLAPTLVPVGGDVNSPIQLQAYITYAYGDFLGGNVVSLDEDGKHGMTMGFFGSVGF